MGTMHMRMRFRLQHCPCEMCVPLIEDDEAEFDPELKKQESVKAQKKGAQAGIGARAGSLKKFSKYR